MYIDVAGAGKIEISKLADWSCGGETGFSFGVEWGNNGYTGGLISKDDAIKLAEHILNVTGYKNKLRKEKILNLENNI